MKNLVKQKLKNGQKTIGGFLQTLSPVAAILWTFLLFDTEPTVQQLIGGVGVIFGVFMVTIRRNA